MQNEVSVLAAFFHMVIFMNNEKRIISFPAGKTYEHILHTSVHAHPIKRGFPKEPTSYVMFRKSGGEMEYLFRVKKTVDFYIQDLLSGTVSLSGIDNAELEARAMRYNRLCWLRRGVRLRDDWLIVFVHRDDGIV